MHTLRRLLTGLAALMFSLSIALVAMVGTASAHAAVISSNPAKGSVIATAPTTITVTTAENMNPDPKKSNLFVYGPGGEVISQGDAKIPLNDPKQMSVAIKPNGDGVYIVRWITVSADDNDPAEGAFSFTVKAGASGTTTTSTPAASLSSTGNTTGNSTDNNYSLLPAIIAGILALVIGGGAGFALGRSRGTKGTSHISSESEQSQEPTKSGR